MPQQKKGTIKEYKKLLYKKQYTHLKVLQLRYSGRHNTGQDRPYFHYGPFERTKTKWRWHRHKTSCRYVTYSRFHFLHKDLFQNIRLNILTYRKLSKVMENCSFTDLTVQQLKLKNVILIWEA